MAVQEAKYYKNSALPPGVGLQSVHPAVDALGRPEGADPGRAGGEAGDGGARNLLRHPAGGRRAEAGRSEVVHSCGGLLPPQAGGPHGGKDVGKCLYSIHVTNVFKKNAL